MLVEVGGSAVPTLRLAVAAIFLLVVAVAKPWSWFEAPDGGGSTGVPASVAASVTVATARPNPTPFPTPSPPPDAIGCLQPVGWRLVLATESEDQLSRTWTVISPSDAMGPSDPRLVPLIVAADDVDGLGFCGDHQAEGTAQAVIAEAWRRDPANGTWAQMPLTHIDPSESDGGVAAMTRPASAVSICPR